MKNFFLKKLIQMVIIGGLNFLIMKTIFSTIPSLNQKISLCKTIRLANLNNLNASENVLFSCKDTVPINTLYETKFLNIKFTTDSKFKLRASLRYKNSELISTEVLTVNPQNDNLETILTFPLDRPTNPKLNRLVSDVDEIVFFISELKNPEKIKINIDEVSIN